MRRRTRVVVIVRLVRHLRLVIENLLARLKLPEANLVVPRLISLEALVVFFLYRPAFGDAGRGGASDVCGK